HGRSARLHRTANATRYDIHAASPGADHGDAGFDHLRADLLVGWEMDARPRPAGVSGKFAPAIRVALGYGRRVCDARGVRRRGDGDRWAIVVFRRALRRGDWVDGGFDPGRDVAIRAVRRGGSWHGSHR